MYIAYIDESGRPLKNCDPKESYVLSALVTHESQWTYIDNQVNQIKQKHFPRIGVEDFELHAKDMLNRAGIFKSLSFKEIYAIFDGYGIKVFP